jgi:hypothetical protein
MKPSKILLPTLVVLALGEGSIRAADPTDAVVVTATNLAASGLAEEAPIGETGRPAWTSHRRFANTRVYIQKEPWEVGIEQWWRARDKRDGTWQNKFQEEIEIGLPYRMQLDVYLDWEADEHRRARYVDTAFELRWALADWGKIPLNPTLYGEYKVVDPANGPDVYEFKLLLGEQLAPRLHWGVNIAYEQEIGGARTTEWQVNQGFSYTVIDDVFSVGVEMKYVDESERGSRGQPERKFLIGPSVQFRPTKNTHIDLVATWGTNQDAQNFEGFVVFGFDFGPPSTKERHYEPTMLRSN